MVKKLPLLLLFLSVKITDAQITAGPSDVVTAPPILAAEVGKLICAGQTITLTCPDTAPTYYWYKINQAGLSQRSTVTGSTYTETSTTAGYYNYQVVVANNAGCISPASNVFKVYVLPAMTASVSSPLNSICSVPGNSVVLTANAPSGFSYVYQWTRNGINIIGATSSTYNVTGETTAGNIIFGVNVSYTMWPLCSASATKTITVINAAISPTIN